MRMTQHRSAIKTKKIDQPVANHFNLPHHSIDKLLFIAIEQNDSWDNRSRKDKRKFLGMSTQDYVAIRPEYPKRLTSILIEGITL
ncbi:hypothetical protein HOLleu_31436 [Holothuria leucospilota]|uniref:Uncharacterized protein n=1 Tax=Holothuria leucospilota TaxID=206669 RepID=A0A9Q1BID7_HOLLE|nr:hypothetical protein HOLleu_31436 [Holothuria leucospilota]